MEFSDPMVNWGNPGKPSLNFSIRLWRLLWIADCTLFGEAA